MGIFRGFYQVGFLLTLYSVYKKIVLGYGFDTKVDAV